MLNEAPLHGHVMGLKRKLRNKTNNATALKQSKTSLNAVSHHIAGYNVTRFIHVGHTKYT